MLQSVQPPVAKDGVNKHFFSIFRYWGAVLSILIEFDVMKQQSAPLSRVGIRYTFFCFKNCMILVHIS